MLDRDCWIFEFYLLNFQRCIYGPDLTAERRLLRAFICHDDMAGDLDVEDWFDSVSL